MNRDPSNQVPGSAWSALGHAWHTARRAPEPIEERTRRILELALDASQAERAFLVRTTPPGSPTIDSVLSRRPDGNDRPSRTLVERSIRRVGSLVLVDAADEARRAPRSSVRHLRLTTALAARVPGEPSFLVLDSRKPPAVSETELGELLESFAALLGFIQTHEIAPDTRPEIGSATAGSVSPAGQSAPDDLVGSSEPVRSARDWIARAAPSRLPVLVLGETGSGKESVARSLHARSDRLHGPFVAINCTALPETLLDAELFGAVRGAYTGCDRDRGGLFHQASGGTLFLDEVGDMPAAMQAKLLRALQEGRVRPVGGQEETAIDVRVVAATHRDLRAEIERGTFRADLYHRLAVLVVRVPPVRERLEDLPLLVDSLAPRLARETGYPHPRLSADALATLVAHDWPGNVRELHSVLARATLRSGGRPIEPQHLGLGPAPVPCSDPRGPEEVPLESAMIENALTEARGSMTEAARRIGWTRQKLYRRRRHWRQRAAELTSS